MHPFFFERTSQYLRMQLWIISNLNCRFEPGAQGEHSGGGGKSRELGILFFVALKFVSNFRLKISTLLATIEGRNDTPDYFPRLGGGGGVLLNP